jgi:hypothetical protein
MQGYNQSRGGDPSDKMGIYRNLNHNDEVMWELGLNERGKDWVKPN